MSTTMAFRSPDKKWAPRILLVAPDANVRTGYWVAVDGFIKVPVVLANIEWRMDSQLSQGVAKTHYDAFGEISQGRIDQSRVFSLEQPWRTNPMRQRHHGLVDFIADDLLRA